MRALRSDPGQADGRDHLGDAPSEVWCADAYRAVFSATRALVRSDAIAEELAQDVLVRAFEQWSDVRHMESPIGWTVQVGLNLARSRLRRFSAETRAHTRWLATRATLASTRTSESDERDEIWAAIRSLPYRQRLAVVMSIVEDSPLADVASELECSYSTAREHARRGRHTLAESLAHLKERSR